MIATVPEPAALPAAPCWLREPLSIGPLRLATRFNLAPLAGYTNYPFRRCIRAIGGMGLCTTDLVNARAILEGVKKTLELLATGADDRPLAVQIFGGKAAELAAAARWLNAQGQAQTIDINMGCPVRKVVAVGGGSSLLCNTSGGTVDLVRQVVEASAVPVTVKMRLGWDDSALTAPQFAREFERVGVAAITIHGRTRAQGFSGRVNLDGIARVVEAVQRIPIFGNGDVMTIADAARMLRHTGCAGIAIGRGALANPWFFRQLQHWVETGHPGPEPTWQDRCSFMRRHLQRLVEWKGSEHYGCVHFRKVATWYARAMRLPKTAQQALVMLHSLAQFDSIMAPYLDAPPRGWTERDPRSARVAVPAGPIAHW